jgi:hypothetical protein
MMGVNWRSPEVLAEARVLAGIADHLPPTKLLKNPKELNI